MSEQIFRLKKILLGDRKISRKKNFADERNIGLKIIHFFHEL